MEVRLAATRVIAAILANNGSLATRLPPMLDQVAPNDRSLLQEMCYGTLRWYPRLSLILESLLARPLQEGEHLVRALLVCGLYQLMEMRLAQHAVVNETVKVASRLGKPWARGLTNAILRNFLRQREDLERKLSGLPEYLHAHPTWLIERFQQEWPDDWLAIIGANNQRPPMTLRVNRGRIDRDQYLQRLQAEGVVAHRATLSEDGIYLQSLVDVAALPGFADGLVSVQDEAAQIVAPLIDMHPQQRILDACAAPGGKTCHLLETCNELEEFVAIDIHPRRLEQVAENLHRLQLSATLISGDAGSPQGWWDGKPFDRILLDAPCSASGVIRRHPDIKLLRRAEDIDKLALEQGAMLQGIWQTLKPGGMLVYITCSIFSAENDAVIEEFVSRQPDARLAPIIAGWGKKTAKGRQLLPEANKNDGFFYARLQKLLA